MRLLSTLLLTLACFSTGCTSPTSEEGNAAAGAAPERTRVLELLAQADTSAFYQAYRTLDAFAYTRYERTVEQEGENTAAPQVRITRIGESPDTSLQAGSAMRRALAPGAAGANLAQFVLPSDPAYLQPRHYDAYRYQLLPDTLLAGTPVRVLEIQARPDADDPPAVRRVRYYLTLPSHTLVAVALQRADRGLWFDETSHYMLRIRPDDAGFVPEIARFVTATTFPFRDRRRIERTVAYYALEPLPHR